VRRIGIGLAAALLIGAIAAPAMASKPLGSPPNSDNVESGHKITICHATSSSNPVQFWEVITVDVASSGGRNKLEGHQGHTEDANNRGRFDVIPEFTYGPDTYIGNSNPGTGDIDEDGTPDWEEWQEADPENGASAVLCVGEGGGGGVG
jgi:hypothetical protein